MLSFGQQLMQEILASRLSFDFRSPGSGSFPVSVPGDLLIDGRKAKVNPSIHQPLTHLFNSGLQLALVPTVTGQSSRVHPDSGCQSVTGLIQRERVIHTHIHSFGSF